MSSESSPLSAAVAVNTHEWQSRIKQVQLEKATPEVMQRIQEASERHRQISHAKKQVSRIEKMNYLSSASNSHTLKQFQQSESLSGGIAAQREAVESEAAKYSNRSSSIRVCRLLISI